MELQLGSKDQSLASERGALGVLLLNFRSTLLSALLKIQRVSQVPGQESEIAVHILLWKLIVVSFGSCRGPSLRERLCVRNTCGTSPSVKASGESNTGITIRRESRVNLPLSSHPHLPVPFLVTSEKRLWPIVTLKSQVKHHEPQPAAKSLVTG